METNIKNTALLVMDMQMGILAMLPTAATLTGNVAKAIAYARSKQVPVIFVTVGFRPGAPEVSLNNKSFAAGKERFASVNMEEFTRVHPNLAPVNGEVTVMKRRVSAFTGSDLEVVLTQVAVIPT
jgi:nicotinamidase-related amidase